MIYDFFMNIVNKMYIVAVIFLNIRTRHIVSRLDIRIIITSSSV